MAKDDPSLREGGGDMIQGVFTTLFGLSSLQISGTLTGLQTWLMQNFTTYSSLSLSNGGLVGYLGLFALWATNDTDLRDLNDNASRGLYIGLILHSAVAWIPDIQTAFTSSTFGTYLLLFAYFAIFAMVNGDWFIKDKLAGGLKGLGGT